MADKPLYYGGEGKDSPMYYGGGGKSSPMYYGSSKSSPIYYGSGRNSPAYYGKGPSYYGKPSYYGETAYGGDSEGGGDGGGMMGAFSIGRILRVVGQRWLSVFVFLLVGLVVSFAVYRISPTVYEASSSLTMDLRRAAGVNGVIGKMQPDWWGTSFAEIFNTHLTSWRSGRIVQMIVQKYRAASPEATTSEDEILSGINGSKLSLRRGARIIDITVRSTNAELCAKLANAYAEAIEQFTDEENKIRCDKAVQQIHANVEKKRAEVDRIAKELMDFRTANKVDSLRSVRETVQAGLSKATGDVLSFETTEGQLMEYEKLLSAVQKEPETFRNLSANVPRAGEISSQFSTFLSMNGKYQNLLLSYTDQHPEVIAAKKNLDTARQQFLEAAQRALISCRTELKVARNRMASLREKQESLRNDLLSCEQRIILAESGLGQLEAEFSIANDVLKGLIMNENQARMEAESNNEIVRLGHKASTPSVPVLPSPTTIFGAGIVVSIGLGLLFVLVLDNLEDTVVNLADIEGRLALKVLAVLPHVRRKRREQVAKFVVEEKYSHFSESVAGLRNLLDSPRYEALSRCMLIISTQPGEGKTITSCSIASSYAQAGKKTLLADFDLRRPRQAKVWGLDLTQDRSFSHTLQEANAKGAKVDFAKLVNKSGVDGLDVIASLPPEGVNPATIFGSSVVHDFFEWARANYDRVIIDSPPYGLVGDVVSLAVMVDSAIIMCCPDRTHFKPIQSCSRCLTEAGANILGVIVNDVEVSAASAFSPSSHHHGGYGSGYGYGGYGYGYGGYGYGEGHRSKSSDEAASAGESDSKQEKGAKAEKSGAKASAEEYTDDE